MSIEEEENSAEGELEKMLKKCSQERLCKLGLSKVPVEEGNGSQPSSPGEGEPEFKKQKMSVPDFEIFMAEMWKERWQEDKPQEGDEYDQFVKKQQKCSKFSPY